MPRKAGSRSGDPAWTVLWGDPSDSKVHVLLGSPPRDPNASAWDPDTSAMSLSCPYLNAQSSPRVRNQINAAKSGAPKRRPRLDRGPEAETPRGLERRPAWTQEMETPRGQFYGETHRTVKFRDEFPHTLKNVIWIHALVTQEST
jgi:hypothetical protein